MRRCLVVLAVLSCLVAAPASAERRWMTVLLDGRKVGSLQIDRDLGDEGVTTTQTLDLRLTRIKTPLQLRTTVKTVESPEGAPLAFYASSNMSSKENLVEGRVRPDGAFQVANTVGGQSKVNLLIWPSGASLVEGQRLATLAHGFKPGTTYQVRNFDSVKQQVANVQVDVIGDEIIEMPDQSRETLHHLRQSLVNVEGAHPVDVWVNDQGYVRRGISPLLGFRLEMASCSESCAKAPDQDVDVLRAAMIDSPRPLTPNFRAAPMRYTITVKGGFPHPFVDTDEQHVTSLGDGTFVVDVGFARRGKESVPSGDDTAPSPWVQSDSPRVVELARSVVGDARNDLQRMRRLRAWLSDYIDRKGLDVGYASALETLDSRTGDCTEHAVLLTALARSLGIPARVVTGVVYVDRLGGASRVFVPHAWSQAFVDGRWISFDSAQRRFDSTHIALGTGNGDPWRFFAAMSTLGHIRIDRAVPASTIFDLPPPSGDGGSFVGAAGSGPGR
ncbi:transglutaminase-like domain-containing protein [Luteibacter aegosomatis]|uniref:transglutaminase-like domain-containing protein n=1 Tax=Luteibacter aegosomatis TaxID=2911537 RepID=UPI001FF7F672|nr:transglutaminase-like domain-containing protein [Luteibacter aegosomatis]UPG84845.1 transglutaminase-like domain-containing protein [Luteibacter aegosomatis]